MNLKHKYEIYMLIIAKAVPLQATQALGGRGV
jgi:hypothetical protein